MKIKYLLVIILAFAFIAGCCTTKQNYADLRMVINYKILDFEECSWKFIPDVIDPRYPGDFYVMLRPEYSGDVLLFPMNIDPKLRKSEEGFIRTNIKFNPGKNEKVIVTILDEDEISKGINDLFSNITLEADIKFIKLKKSTDTVAVFNEWVVCGEQTFYLNDKPPTKNKPLVMDFEKIKLWFYFE